MNATGLFGYVDKDVLTFDRHREMFLTDTVVEAMLARRDIVLPAVPGAGDDAARELAFGYRTTSVRADAVHRMKASVHLKQGHDARPGYELFAGAFRNIIHAGNRNTCARQDLRSFKFRWRSVDTRSGHQQSLMDFCDFVRKSIQNVGF